MKMSKLVFWVFNFIGKIDVSAENTAFIFRDEDGSSHAI
jgi:hypothetical protein